MSQEYVFRFLSVRPPNPEKKVEQRPSKTDLYPPLVDSPLRAEIAQVEGTAGATEAIAAMVARFRESGQAVGSLDGMRFAARAGIDWALAHADLKVSDAATSNGIEKIYGMPAKKVVDTPAFKESLTRLADTIYAEALVPSGAPLPDQLVTAHKFMLLLLQLGSPEVRGEQTIGDLVGARILLVPGLKPPLGSPPQPDERPPPPDPNLAQITAAQQKLASYDQAHRELANAMSVPSALTAAPATKEECEARLAEMAARVAQLEQQRGAETPLTAPGAPVAKAAAANLLLSSTVGQALSDNTKSVLAELRFDPGNLNPLFALGSMERQMSLMGTQLSSSVQPAAYVMLGGVQLEKAKVLHSLGVAPWMGKPGPLLKKTCQFQAGIGDLLMVKQTLKAYELGEFAHVENVLAGETREREHRRLDTSEQTITTEQETDTQKEKDLQTTHRNEMQTEANKTVKEQFGLEAGLQVSGSYGPVVSFAAHLNASFSTSSEETQRKAVSFSQEVTEKSSEKVTQRIKETVMHRVLQEIQEINKHIFTNTSSSKHIRGIYRWLNKLYDAQIFNYGQRMMYEFVVPEPAAWFIYAMLNNPPTDSEIVKPVPPTYSGNALKPAHLTRANYVDYVALYQVRGVPAPPPEYLTAAYFDKQDNVDQGSNFGRAGKVAIPDGYEAMGATVMTDYLFTKDKEHVFHVMLGGQPFDATNYWGPAYQGFGARPQELSVSYKLQNAWTFCLGIDVVCRLRSDGFAKWQQQVYDSIMEAYLKQKADYEEKLAVQKMQQGPQQFGRNPLENQRLAKEELKKLLLMMLIGTDDIARNSYYTSTEPLMRLDKACENGSWIRFFENAFEWTNMLYVFYPYFWGRHARWISAIHLTDPDSDFAAFLRAGAARVQIPVRPGFEKAVVHFLQFGEIWNGNDPPMRDDDLYVPIVDEIAANLGKFDNEGVPYPADSKPWTVRVPTELVLVENLEEVPNIVDMLTGNPVTIKG